MHIYLPAATLHTKRNKKELEHTFETTEGKKYIRQKSSSTEFLQLQG